MALLHQLNLISNISLPPSFSHHYNHIHSHSHCHSNFVVLGFLNPSTTIRPSVSRVFTNPSFPLRQWMLRAAHISMVDSVTTTATTTATVEIPVTCYQIIGVSDQAEKDEIVKSVMQLKNTEVEDGYTMDTITSRRDLLMDVRDKLLFEPEYAGNVKDKIPPKSSLRIPWPWLPAALCLLQEVGGEKLVLDIGQAALQRLDAKPYIHDLILAMALAECAIAKIAFEKYKVSLGFEALARAQSLLRSKISLGKMALLSQIEESLERLAPACTLELLGMPHSPENSKRRQGAISALCELLRQGLDVETSSRVQDWQCFLSQALNRLMASEIVGLLPWDSLAIIRKNKKSLESQNQRVVIDFNCFYVVLMAHIAVGFSSKRKELINKAKILCECLMASEAIDLKFEEVFCLFLLGQNNEAEVVEKLHQLELNSNHAARSLVSGKEIKDVSGVKPSLEMWLKDSVLTAFSDTRDCSPSFVEFFGGDKGIKKSKVAAQTNPNVTHGPLTDIASKWVDCGESLQYMNFSQNLGLASTDVQSSLTMGNSGSRSNDSEPSIQFKRNLGAHHDRAWESWLSQRDVAGKITFFAAIGCIAFIIFKLSGMSIRKMRIGSRLAPCRPKKSASSLAWTKDFSLDYNVVPGYNKGGIAGVVKKLLTMIKISGNQSDSRQPQSSGPAARSSSMATVFEKHMPVEEAEALVKHWQAIKAEALGPSHQIHTLSEVLDESMLYQWEALAHAAKARCCYWRFVLLQLSVMKADIFSDGFGVERAEIEAVVEEAAELVDESQEKNPNYYSMYKINYSLKRQEDGSWRFCEGEVETETAS